MKKDQNFDIDYDMFTTLEIIKIIEFFNLIISTKTKKVSKELLVTKYREYQNIINNKAMEKKYDKMLEEKEQVSIYRTMKNLL